MSSSPGPLAPQYVHGIYIPSALLVVGCAIVKMDWLPYAIALAAVLATWKFLSSRECPDRLMPRSESMD